MEKIRFITYQITRALLYMHSRKILHRDLKPRNILINSDGLVKLCDFGLSRYELTKINGIINPLTDVIATRYYRSPEILLCLEEYDSTVDIWALGCCICELFLRKPIFQGNDSQHTLNLIFEMIGTPTFEEITKINKGGPKK